MIKSIRLQNFFGFQDCTINLEKGANVLVGINGSGKSNFLKAIKLLKAAYEGKLAELLVYSPNGFRGFQNIFHNQIGTKEDNKITLGYTFDLLDHPGQELKEIIYELQIIVTNKDRNEYFLLEKVWGEKDGREVIFFAREEDLAKIADFQDNLYPLKTLAWNKTESLINRVQSESPGVLDLAWQLVAINVYENFNIEAIRQGEVPKPARKYLSEDFSDAISFFEYLEKSENANEREAFVKIVDGLKNVNDKYKGLTTIRRPGKIELSLKEENLLDQNALNMSDGTIRFFCLLLILYNPFGPNTGWVRKIICMDEPEAGLHPDMIHTLGEAIEYATQTGQVIISTHSPHLLDYFELENIRVFEKGANNETEIFAYREDDFKGWYDSFNPGQMWQSGDIGGNRW